jgi:site-specific DNA recombinase
MKRPRAVVYSRVSSALQERDGVSLDAQVDLARRFCEVRGFDLLAPLYDTMSGQKDNRPGLATLEAMVKGKEVDHVLVYKIDRLSRDPAHYHQLLQTFQAQGIGLASLTEDIDATTSMGRFMLGMLISMAALEADRTADRVRDSCLYRARQGRLLLGKECPLGYLHHKAHTTAEGVRVPGRLEVDPASSEVVRYLYEHFATAQTIRRLTLDAIGQGYTRPDGRPLNQQGVRRILRNPLYCGMHAALKKRTIGTGATKRTIEIPRGEWLMTSHHMPAIVSREVWDEAQSLMEANAILSPGLRSSRPIHPWSGVLRCGYCGTGMVRTAGASLAIGRYTCPRWQAYRDNACQGPLYIGEAFLNSYVVPALSEAVEAATTRRRASRKPVARKPAPKMEPLAALREIAEQQERLGERYDMGRLSRAAYMAKVEALDRAAEALAAARTPTHTTLLPFLPTTIADDWMDPAMSSASRGRLLRILVNHIIVHRDSIEVWLKAFADPSWPTEPLLMPIINMSSRAARLRTGKT